MNYGIISHLTNIVSFKNNLGLLKGHKNRIFLACVLCFVIPVCIFGVQRCMELYFVYVVGLHEATTRYKFLDSTVAQLPIDYALLFVDDVGRYGYVYFDKLEYYRARYVFIIYDMGVKTEQKGKLTKWTYYPWRCRTMRDSAIFDKNEKLPHFTWIPFNALGFRKPKIVQVGMVPLANVQNTSFETNRVEWIQTGSH